MCYTKGKQQHRRECRSLIGDLQWNMGTSGKRATSVVGLAPSLREGGRPLAAAETQKARAGVKAKVEVAAKAGSPASEAAHLVPAAAGSSGSFEE